MAYSKNNDLSYELDRLYAQQRDVAGDPSTTKATLAHQNRGGPVVSSTPQTNTISVKTRIAPKTISFAGYQTYGLMQEGDKGYYRHGKENVLCKVIGLRSSSVDNTTHKVEFSGVEARKVGAPRAWVKPQLLNPVVCMFFVWCTGVTVHCWCGMGALG